MKKFQRIAAIAGIVLLLLLYLTCFVCAVIGSEQTQVLFRITLGMTVALPILLYSLILLVRLASKRTEPSILFPAKEPEILPEKPKDDEIPPEA